MPNFSLKLQEKTQIANQILELRFTQSADLKFSPGQFVQFCLPTAENKIAVRSYSLASLPNDPYLEFCVKLIPEGLGSTFFANLEIGAEANTRGPFGRFVLPEKIGSRQFIATGVGLAPIYPLIKYDLATNQNSYPIHLLFGVRAETDVFWLDRLDTLVQNYSNFSYTLTLSQPTENWAGERGRVTAKLNSSMIADKYYICGNPEMILETKKILESNEINPKDILTEVF